MPTYLPTYRNRVTESPRTMGTHAYYVSVGTYLAYKHFNRLIIFVYRRVGTHL